jgi:lipid A 3-O-deacylase PagL
MTIRRLSGLVVSAACLTYPALALSQDSNSQSAQPSDEIVGDTKPADSNAPSDNLIRAAKPTDRNSRIYYKNKLEFSLETGCLPINIPFPFDFLLGDGYNMTPLHYTLVPAIGSLQWQMGDVRGPLMLRGNWDLRISGAFTAIPRGAETHYAAYDMGIRRNFVGRNGRVAPYLDYRLGLGRIDAKGPKGVPYAQGQDFTFTMMMGSGFRYNFNSTYAFSAGITWMHISNLYLSEPKYLNYGINVYGPIIGLSVRLAKPSGESAHH